jgi:putative toxin-antitoxin system antitoxin component (TIGR02293 family)
LIATPLYLILGNWHTMMCRMPNREDLPQRAKEKGVSVHKVASNAKPRPAKSSMGLGDSSQVVTAVRRGVEAGMYQWLKESLDVSDQRLSSVVRISQRTVKRRLGEGRFHPDESERLVRVARLTERTKEVFEDPERAREWLKSPQFALGGEIPLEYADTEPGAQIVEDLLGRIEHGTPV